MKPILDVSHHQLASDFDWDKVAKAISGLIIRVQYGSSTIDRQYKAHVASAKAHKIPFGHYAYGRFVSIDDAKKEANDFLYRIDKKAKFLVLDVEKDTLASCGPENLAEASQAFIDVCKKAGHKVGFYVSHEMYKHYGLDKVKADFLWLPRYGDDNGKPALKPDYKCDLWQYSQKCRIDGYNGGLDMSLLNGTKKIDYFFGAPKVADRFPFPGTQKEGSRGSHVKLIQSKLGIADDGIFGEKTEKAVKTWQGKHKLKKDGIVGPKTWKEMFD